MGRDDAPPAGADDRTPAGSAGSGGPPADAGGPPADVEELPVGGLIPTASPPDPASMLQTAVDLLSPAEAARQLPWIISEMTKIATGESELEYGAKDARFKDRTWTANPAYRGLA